MLFTQVTYLGKTHGVTVAPPAISSPRATPFVTKKIRYLQPSFSEMKPDQEVENTPIRMPTAARNCPRPDSGEGIATLFKKFRLCVSCTAT